jgi:hypothetical protein
VFSLRWQGRQGRTPDASCESGQALEKAQNGNGSGDITLDKVRSII